MTLVLPVEWATDDNYDAGTDPWSGAPTKSAPTAEEVLKGFIPESPASAQALNYLLNAASQAVNLWFGFRNLQLQNWPYKQETDIATTDSWTQGDPAWDSNRSEWLIGASEASVETSVWSSPNGRVWTKVGSGFAGAGSLYTTVVFDPDNYHIYATHVGNLYDWDGSTWNAIVTSGVFVYNTGKWFNNQAVFVGFNNVATAKAATYTTADGWVDRTVPAACLNNAEWKSAAGPALMVAIPYVGDSVNGMYTDDGETWTEMTIATETGDETQDIAYGDGLFMIIAQTTAGETRVMTGDDGATWTEVAVIPDILLTSLTYLNGVWYGQADGGGNKGYMSMDNGLTWRHIDGMCDLSGNTYRLECNGRQILAVSLAGSVGAAAGSISAGMPPDLLTVPFP